MFSLIQPIFLHFLDRGILSVSTRNLNVQCSENAGRAAARGRKKNAFCSGIPSSKQCREDRLCLPLTVPPVVADIYQCTLSIAFSFPFPSHSAEESPTLRCARTRVKLGCVLWERMQQYVRWTCSAFCRSSPRIRRWTQCRRVGTISH